MASRACRGRHCGHQDTSLASPASHKHQACTEREKCRRIGLRNAADGIVALDLIRSQWVVVQRDFVDDKVTWAVLAVIAANIDLVVAGVARIRYDPRYIPFQDQLAIEVDLSIVIVRVCGIPCGDDMVCRVERQNVWRLSRQRNWGVCKTVVWPDRTGVTLTGANQIVHKEEVTSGLAIADEIVAARRRIRRDVNPILGRIAGRADLFETGNDDPIHSSEAHGATAGLSGDETRMVKCHGTRVAIDRTVVAIARRVVGIAIQWPIGDRIVRENCVRIGSGMRGLIGEDEYADKS